MRAPCMMRILPAQVRNVSALSKERQKQEAMRAKELDKLRAVRSEHGLTLLGLWCQITSHELDTPQGCPRWPRASARVSGVHVG